MEGCMFVEKMLLEAHIKHICFAENIEELEAVKGMAQERLDNLYEMKLEAMIKENVRALAAMNYSGATIIIRKDYDYMDQCASSYFRVPKERAEEISRTMDEEYSHQFYKGEDMEHLIAKEMGIEFLAKVWEEDAGPSCSYEPYEKQQAEMNATRSRRKR